MIEQCAIMDYRDGSITVYTIEGDPTDEQIDEFLEKEGFALDDCYLMWKDSICIRLKQMVIPKENE
jgi:hypothetical protein